MGFAGRYRSHPRHRPLALAITAMFAFYGPDVLADKVPVTSCLDDGSPGTLRYSVLTANDADEVDLTALTCSTITLGSTVNVDLDNLTIEGSGADKITIDANHTGRVFRHSGNGKFYLDSVTVTGGLYTSQHALGGCIYSKGSVGLTDAVVTGCEVRGLAGGSGAGGGGVLAYNLSLTNSTLSANTAQYLGTMSTTKMALGGGAAVLNRFSILFGTVAENHVYAVSGESAGGGVYVVKNVDIKYCSISGNTASVAAFDPQYSAGLGAGLVLDTPGPAAWSMQACTVSGNHADIVGGLFIGGGSATGANIQNSTISGNVANIGEAGVAIGIPLTISNSTIAFNAAGSYGGGGVLAQSSKLVLETTIIADNSPNGTTFAADLDGSATISGHNNLVKLVGSTVILPAGTLRLDPKLDVLQDNGGPTRTHALLPGSPAIDAGNNTLGSPYDQRRGGFPRVVGLAADIGAFETNPDIIFVNGFN